MEDMAIYRKVSKLKVMGKLKMNGEYVIHDFVTILHMCRLQYWEENSACNCLIALKKNFLDHQAAKIVLKFCGQHLTM